MDREDFLKAAYDLKHRPKLLAALQGDSVLREAARAEVKRCIDGQARGQLMDRDHISRMTHDMLVQILAQVDASKPVAGVEEV